MALIFPKGTTATLADLPSGTPTAIANLRSVGENDIETKFGDVTALADGVIAVLPSGRLEPGEVEVGVFLDDTAPATNFLTIVKTKQAAGQKVSLAVNLPGTFDNTTALIGPYQGYIGNVSQPAVEVGDEPLSFKFKIKVSPA